MSVSIGDVSARASRGPTSSTPSEPGPVRLPISIGDDLVMRTPRCEEAARVVDFNTRIFDERVTGWARDLLSGRHPTVAVDDFTIVEHRETRKIVSSMGLISQTWMYGETLLPVGRLELIGTDPAYRRRGLIRQQFEVAHARSAAKGELLQVIAGVDWYYRQFGYELGMQLWGSCRLDGRDLSDIDGGPVDSTSGRRRRMISRSSAKPTTAPHAARSSARRGRPPSGSTSSWGVRATTPDGAPG